MEKKDFSKIESNFQEYFSIGKNFSFKDKNFTVHKCDKPTTPSGEPKTDIYILGIDNSGAQKEFKISIKLDNAEFLENKISLKRAMEILGDDAQQIIEKSISEIKKVFSKEPLINFNKAGRSKSRIVTLGWKFELMNKKSGNKSGKILLKNNQKEEVFSGKASMDKKDAYVHGEIIKNAGVANFIYIAKKINIDMNVFNDLISISSYAKQSDIYFACKALNYRVDDEKWDGNRPLAVWVKRKLIKNKLNQVISFKNPLDTKGNSVAEKLLAILNKLKVSKENFDDLKKHL
tara:strand:- start:2637 stop:3506 length:870 start_codon:yes stop_codon:yes gene_type:complete